MYCYLLWNTITDRGYVGITRQNLWKRIRSHTHSGPSKTSRLITQAIHKHGTENFTLRVLGQTDTLEKLYLMEQYWIAELNTLCPHGYNRTPGGDPILEHKHGPEARKLMGEKVKAHWDTYGHSMLGRTQSEATKAKISEKAKARHAAVGHPFVGRKHSEDTKAKIAAAHQGKSLSEEHKAKLRGHTHTPETRLAMSLSRKGRKAWNKGIPWHDITKGKLHPGRHRVELGGVVYESVMACHKITGISRPTIRAMIKRGDARYVPLEEESHA
jgi:group I intron endonuclease